ncbi:related to Kinesin-like protein KIF2C [Sporisorium reilianum SRZ2]|uniref:Kinesin-like protein n=1 Tax=Sporisorium reilianum (strain SRZ2) TaxID=999809 RepID=E6ZWK6_SPORE|nr:related to Kinesin-like protein KIF2C [Sporisorium reilianum SRZ2]
MERDFTVLFRIRPSFLSSTSTPLITTDATSKQAIVLEPRTNVHTATTHTTHAFDADHCYLPTAATEDLFAEHVEPLIPFVLSGGYATVLAYGQTGSGKTFTLSACSRLAISSLFAANEGNCDVSVQAIEIYAKNKVNDLFDASNARVMIAENIAGSSTFAKATTKSVDSADAMLAEVESAWAQRITRGTEKNPQSSRSHALIRISCQSRRDKNATPGVLQLVDLAGSERAADHSSPTAAAAGTNTAMRIAETVAINTSLMTLKSCIRARTCPAPPPSTGAAGAAAGVPHIPFRSSKLTLALKEAFDLYSRQPTHTLFIATASPDAVDVAATLNTLRYASALVASPHARIELQPDALGRNVFFWTPSRLTEWLLKYGSPLLGAQSVAGVLDGMDGARFARVPEGEFYVRIQAAREGAWTAKDEAAAKELYLKWWKLVIASRTLSQKALEQQWKSRQAEKVKLEEETRQDKEVQRLLRLPGIAAAPTSA